MSKFPLNALKVLDISSVLAGPLTGSFFAEMGAVVLKIENKRTGGDVTRQWKLPSENPNDMHSAYYSSANYGKKIILLDLMDSNDRNQLETYISEADVVISNFQKKTAQKLDLDPNEIVRRYPNLIFTQLSAYTWDDPRPGYDLVMQGETGWISMNGTDDEHLAKLPVAVMDVIASHQMRTATLLAMLNKAKTGKGSVIHVSLYKSALSALANQASNYLMAGHVPVPLGTLHPNIAPYGDIFFTACNQKIMLAIGSDAQFNKLWFTLINDIEKYPNFELNSDRVKNRSQLSDILQNAIHAIEKSSLVKKLDANQLPYCFIHNLSEVFNTPLAKEMVHTEKYGNYSSRSVSSVAFELFDNVLE